MRHIDEIKDYWNRRANGFSLAVQEELETQSAEQWENVFRENLTGAHLDVLDDGAGAGFFSVILARLGHRVTAIDYSERMVAETGARFAALGVDAKMMQMDAQKLQFADQQFDAVVSRNVIWNLDDPAKAYAEIARVLRPGGTLIVDDGNMYLYHHDAQYAALHEAAEKQQTDDHHSLHAKYNVDKVDFSVIEKIAKDLPMSSVRRPQWDFEQLVLLDFYNIHIVLKGGKLPMRFQIVAKKKEADLA